MPASNIPVVKELITKNWFYWVITVFRFLVDLTGGAGLGLVLYSQCLNCEKCNTVVVSYISIISLACWTNLGIPVDKFIKLDKLKELSIKEG